MNLEKNMPNATVPFPYYFYILKNYKYINIFKLKYVNKYIKIKIF